MEPESATPATAAAEHSAASSAPPRSSATVTAARAISGSTGDVRARLTGRRVASGIGQTDQGQIVLVAPRLVKRYPSEHR